MAFATQLSLGVARRSASARVPRAAKPMAKRAHAAMASTLSDFSIDALGGDKPLDLAAAKGKVCLVENGTTKRDYLQMNELVDKFGSDDFTIFAFPCNQFFRQSQDTDAETLNLLKHVRPGDGYVPKFEHSTKIEVNGAGAHPIFTWLRESLPNPVDEAGKEIMGDHTRIAWDPVCRNDLSWNFEKFLINQEGVPVRRYSPKHETIDVAADIDKLIKDGPNALA